MSSFPVSVVRFASSAIFAVHLLNATPTQAQPTSAPPGESASREGDPAAPSDDPPPAQPSAPNAPVDAPVQRPQEHVGPPRSPTSSDPEYPQEHVLPPRSPISSAPERHEGPDPSLPGDQDSSTRDVAVEDEVEDEVVVSGARRARVPGSVQVIGKKQLERLDFDDAHEVLRQVPGVFVREEDGLGLRPNIAMRGVNPDRSKKITLMEDGVLFGPAPYSAPAAYYFPLMKRVTRVDVIKGPAAVAYGPQTVAGAIDLSTRAIPATASSTLDIGIGQYGYRQIHGYAGASNEQFGFLIEGVHLGNNGFKTLPNGENTGMAKNEWMVKGSYLVDPRAAVQNELSIKLGFSQEASNETYLGLSNADFDRDPNRRYPASNLDRMDNHRTNVALTHELTDYERNIELRTTVYRNDFFRIWRKFNHLGGASAADVLADPTDPENAAYYGVLTGASNTSSEQDTLYIGPNQRKFVSQGIQMRYRQKLSTGPLVHQLEAGVRLHNDSIERDHREQPYAMVSGELYPIDVAETRTTNNFAETFAAAIHVSDAIGWGNLTATPGLRVEGIHSSLTDYLGDTKSERNDLIALPGLGLYYAFVDELGALAGAYRGFSPAEPGSDPSTRPEWSVNYEAGLRYSSAQARAELIGFFNDYENLTDICTFSSGCENAQLDRQYSAGRAYIYGLESLASADFAIGALKLPASAVYTLSFGRFQNDFTSVDPIYGTVQKGDEIPYLPRHQLRLQLAAEFHRLGAYAAFSYVSAVRETAGAEPLAEVLSTDPLMKFDVGLSAQVMPWLQLYAHARNLLDYQGIAAHRPYGARPNAPRWILAGVELKL